MGTDQDYSGTKRIILDEFKEHDQNDLGIYNSMLLSHKDENELAEKSDREGLNKMSITRMVM